MDVSPASSAPAPAPAPAPAAPAASAPSKDTGAGKTEAPSNAGGDTGASPSGDGAGTTKIEDGASLSQDASASNLDRSSEMTNWKESMQNLAEITGAEDLFHAMQTGTDKFNENFLKSDTVSRNEYAANAKSDAELNNLFGQAIADGKLSAEETQNIKDAMANRDKQAAGFGTAEDKMANAKFDEKDQIANGAFFSYDHEIEDRANGRTDGGQQVTKDSYSRNNNANLQGYLAGKGFANDFEQKPTGNAQAEITNQTAGATADATAVTAAGATADTASVATAVATTSDTGAGKSSYPSWVNDDFKKAIYDHNTQEINAFQQNHIANLGKEEPPIQCSAMGKGQSPFSGFDSGAFSSGFASGGLEGASSAGVVNPQDYLKEDGSYDIAKAFTDSNTQQINAFQQNHIANLGKEEPPIQCTAGGKGQSVFSGFDAGAFDSGFTSGGLGEASSAGIVNPENYMNEDGSYDVAKAFTDSNTQQINAFQQNYIANLGKEEPQIRCKQASPLS